jgi:glycosyltransferase involved in cell wall biosynthesis
MPGPELSVITRTYNRREILLKAPAAHQVQSAQLEILEVLALDDGSTDATPEAVPESRR